MIGLRFGRWLVVDYPVIKGNRSQAYCTCVCGASRVVRVSSLTSGDSTSCGCYAKELAAARLTKHGLSSHPMYSIWFNMIRRCYNDERLDYKYYGGRGISVCDSWLGDLGLKTFIKDMYPTFEEGLELDRIDNSSGYSKDNCKWSTRSEQNINKRWGSFEGGVKVSYKNEEITYKEWEELSGIPIKVLTDRVGKLGWSVDKATTTPLRPKRVYLDVQGEIIPVKDIFKSPAYNHAMKYKLNTSKYLNSVLGNVGKVYYESCGEIYSEDYVHHEPLTMPEFSEEFKRILELTN